MLRVLHCNHPPKMSWFPWLGLLWVLATASGTPCDQYQLDKLGCGCGPDRETFENEDINECCDGICNRRKRGNNIPEKRVIQDELFENDKALVRYLLQNEKYKADFAQYLEQSWPDDKSAFLNWLSQELKI